MEDWNKCALCDLQLDPEGIKTLSDDIYRVTCLRCGKYEIEGLLAHTLPHTKELKDKRYLISGKTRTYFESTGKPLLLAKDDLDSIISSAPTTIPDRKYELLKYLATKSKHIGKLLNLDLENDYAIVYGKNSQELLFMIKFFADSEFVLHTGGVVRGKGVQLSAKGWEEYQRLQTTPIDSNQVFLAMKFPKKDSKDKIDIQLSEAYENGFIPGIEDTGHDCLRIDKKQHNKKVCEEIIYEIKQSKFLVADMTGHRGGVYFEAGYALALGKEVVWTCHESDTGNIHFDTQQYNRISWKDAEDLRKQLKNRIFGSVGRGKNEVKPD